MEVPERCRQLAGGSLATVTRLPQRDDESARLIYARTRPRLINWYTSGPEPARNLYFACRRFQMLARGDPGQNVPSGQAKYSSGAEPYECRRSRVKSTRAHSRKCGRPCCFLREPCGARRVASHAGNHTSAAGPATSAGRLSESEADSPY